MIGSIPARERNIFRFFAFFAILLHAFITFLHSFASVGNVVLFSCTVVSDKYHWGDDYFGISSLQRFTLYANIFSKPFSPIRF